MASSRTRLARVRKACTSSAVAILGAGGGSGGFFVLAFPATVTYCAAAYTYSSSESEHSLIALVFSARRLSHSADAPRDERAYAS